MMRRLIVMGSLALGATGTQVVLANADSGEQLGPVRGSVQPFITELDGKLHVVLAGTQESPRHRYTVVDGTPYPVHASAWMAQPIPLKNGMTVTAVAQDAEGRELFKLTTEPLHEGVEPQPLAGPSWTGYGPEVR